MGILLLGLVSCDASPVAPPQDDPLFGPGEYGGTALEGTEDLYNLAVSPDGSRIALVRRHTPGRPLDPRNQLWIVDADGSNPQFVGPGVNSADWSPDGKQLAVTVFSQTASFVFTVDLETMRDRQWTGREGDYLSEVTTSSANWFVDGQRLLVFVWGLAYQQPYPRGTYTLDTETGEVKGPLLELMQAARLGDSEQVILGRKYVDTGDSQADRNGNWARHDLATDTWAYITDVPRDSVDFLYVSPNPVGPEAVMRYRAGHAEQLWLMQNDGSARRRLTELGGSNPRWHPDGSRFLFRRDEHRGSGARWVPMVYEVASDTERMLWPSLPGGVPAFPPVPPPGGAQRFVGSSR